MSLPSQAAAESGRRWNIITSYKACLPLCGDVICFASFYGGKGFGGSYENFSTNTLRFDSGGAFNRLWHCRGNRAHIRRNTPSDLGTSDSEAVQESELTLDSASDSASEMLYDYEIKTSADGSQYAVIKGFRDDNATCSTSDWNAVFPKELGGVAVTAFAPYAFRRIFHWEIIVMANFGFRRILSRLARIALKTAVLQMSYLKNRICLKLPLMRNSRFMSGHLQGTPGYGESILVTGEVLLKNEVFADCAETGYIYVICPTRIKQQK